MILHDLSRDELAAVERIGVPMTFGRGDQVIREGDAGTSFFLILDGRVEVRKELGTGRYKRLVELGPLDIFGEVCFLGVECRSASVVALDPTQALEFTREHFERLMSERPLIGLKLYRGIARELAQRLARVDSDLKDALVWALGDTKSSLETGAVAGGRKLTVLPPARGAGTSYGRLVIE